MNADWVDSIVSAAPIRYIPLTLHSPEILHSLHARQALQWAEPRWFPAPADCRPTSFLSSAGSTPAATDDDAKTDMTRGLEDDLNAALESVLDFPPKASVSASPAGEAVIELSAPVLAPGCKTSETHPLQSVHRWTQSMM
jgi:hypothetical protein